MSFTIHRGTNISHWLSQSDQRGPGRAAFFTHDDVKRIADWGFDHIRLPIDEEQMWDLHGAREPEAFKLLDSALDWCERQNLRTVVDLHILRSHHFNQKEAPALFADPAETRRFNGLWEQLSDHMRGRSVERVAYELLNEAVAPDPNDWNRVAIGAFNTVRQREPQRTIVYGSNRWNSPNEFDTLQVPDDQRLILTFHFYSPMLLTHYRANWSNIGDYDGPVNYPGPQVSDEAIEKLPEPLRTNVRKSNKPFDRSAMLAELAKPLAVHERTGLPLYCGEFGCYQRAPEPLRRAWYRDIISVFKERNIGWANWDYKGGFALVGPDGKSTGIAEILLA